MKSVTIGIGGALGHDSNAAIFVNGELIAAAQEERFTRFKHDPAFPCQSIKYCLAKAEVREQDVTTCVFSEKVLQYSFCRPRRRRSNIISRSLGKILPLGFADHWTSQALVKFPNADFKYVWHHLSHAAGAFFTSNFDSAAFLCVDGAGEDISASIGVFKDGKAEFVSEQAYQNGLGFFYAMMTNFLGFPQFGDEYKVMGLSPYGTACYLDQLRSLFTQGENGGLQLLFQGEFTNRSKEQFMQIVEKAVGLPKRQESDLILQAHMDLAASLQVLFEEELLDMARMARNLTGAKKLVFCGGCAQNCVSAGKLRRSGVFEDVFVSPVGGDMGTGLGAATYYESTVTKQKKFSIDTRGYHLGPEPGEPPPEAMRCLIDGVSNLHVEVAKLLAEGKIVGWVRGGAELGARALGARSILADPRIAEMQSLLNLKIKFRESFRPFAPAILAEEADRWFDSGGLRSDYMQYTSLLRDELKRYPTTSFDSFQEQLNFSRCSVPSIVHVDFSARLQTVHEDIHRDFYLLISEFFKLTGVPMVINTSFNVNKEPIVLTAEDAWNCFINTDIDYLAIEDRLFFNPFERTREDKIKWRQKFVTF